MTEIMPDIIDSFLGVEADMTTHVGERGSEWMKVSEQEVWTNNWRWPEGSPDPYYRTHEYNAVYLIASGIPSGREYDVRAWFTMLSEREGDHRTYLTFLGSETEPTFFAVGYVEYWRQWRLAFVKGGDIFPQATWDDVVKDFPAYRAVEVCIREGDPQISIWIDGVLRMTFNDDQPAPGNRIGLHGVGTNPTLEAEGVRLEQIEVISVPAQDSV